MEGGIDYDQDQDENIMINKMYNTAISNSKSSATPTRLDWEENEVLSSLNNDSGEKGNGKTADSQNKKTSGTNEKALNEKLAYYTGGYGTKLLSKQVMPSNLSYKAVSLAN